MERENFTVKALHELYDADDKHILEEFFQFLQFKSISTDSSYKSDMLACAGWLKELFQTAGFSIERIETTGYPVLLASWLKAGPDKPTILFYGHYDVQPVDPIELWKSPPFEPIVRDGQVYARGATDNKGQIFYTICALRALLKRDGKLPVNVKIIIEGEEETNGTSMSEVLASRKNDVSADYVAIVDLGIHRPNVPTLSLGLRGIVTMEVELTGANTDLHSGSHGGVVYNTNHVLVEVLSKLRDHNGRIQVPGFYDDVLEPEADELKLMDFSFDVASYEKTFETKANGGESAFSPAESAWLRPTLEINGLWGGYTGHGFKTVIPAKAYAKISCRLVPNQDPGRTIQSVADFIRKNVPEGIKVETKTYPGGGAAIRTSPNDLIVKIGAQAMTDVFEKPCQFVLEGASVPVVPKLREATESEMLLIGLTLPTDNLHAPNEHFGLDRLRLGFAIIGRIVGLLGQK